ncbi:hypothetical protein VOLCADRAFT_98338 [Volvox carteri f. nagariensis]|uniref:Glycosyltransferase family 92 protein n=1 Tax=Volvox carteri f. nagariensis TaxID=3068 RepID=D8UF33_VOLCA|nr:uncharacterized protein VOLCADRAFT_98338 [Volvox carteri f. nagariensis]EFJ41610.1 hypothetical protein VOLCADRAFT_98338 [Volvox carteri f. nagariensis]|eukprot:XP_002957266.1 hypothetical protein VOLCADRAFT_98338 [Volvox carteri f. nagariensis]
MAISNSLPSFLFPISFCLASFMISASAGVANHITGIDRAVLSASSVPSSIPVLEPLWGCESPALPPGSFHVVVSTYNADPEQVLPWLWHLGLTNAAVFLYYRIDDPYIQRQYHGTVKLPCSMSLNVIPLLPNKGREAAVFLHHIVTHYDNLPLLQTNAKLNTHANANLFTPKHPKQPELMPTTPCYWHTTMAPPPATPCVVPSIGEQGASTGAWTVSSAVPISFVSCIYDSPPTDQLTHPPHRQDSFSSRDWLTSMVVTLSSGCVESWARGCCSEFICSSYRPACPFITDNCTYTEKSRRAKDVHRHIFMHQFGMYDARHENQVVGPDSETRRPVALLRYVGAAHRSTEMWNISHEYPPDEKRHSKEHTLQPLHHLHVRLGPPWLLQDLLERYNFTARKKSHFKSCCASLVLRKQAVRRWPVELYKYGRGGVVVLVLVAVLTFPFSRLSSLALPTRPPPPAATCAHTYVHTHPQAVSGPGWALWLDRDYNTYDTLAYIRVDFHLKHIQGCPAQFTPQFQELVRVMRGHAEGGPEQG